MGSRAAEAIAQPMSERRSVRVVTDSNVVIIQVGDCFQMPHYVDRAVVPTKRQDLVGRVTESGVSGVTEAITDWP